MTESTRLLLRQVRRCLFWPFEAVLALSLFGATRLLPPATSSALMGAIFEAIGPLTPWQGRARRNLALAMPELDAAGQRRVLSGMWNNFGRVVGEFPHMQRIAASGRIQFSGLEHLQALDSGAFLVGAHIGNWETGPYAALSVGHKVAAIYRPLNNPLLSGLLERRQAHYGGDIFRKGREAALGMVSALRKGQMMCLLVDQQLREGMPVPFFGHPAQTSISHIKLAIRKKVPLIHMHTERLGGCHFRVTISPPLALPESDGDGDIVAVATQINSTIEGWIRARPEHWFWPHRRWGKHI